MHKKMCTLNSIKLNPDHPVKNTDFSRANIRFLGSPAGDLDGKEKSPVSA